MARPADTAATTGTPGGVALPAPPGRIRRFWREHPVVTDSLLVLVWGAAAVWSVFLVPERTGPVGTAVAVVLVLAAAVSIPLRRRDPRLTVLAGAGPVVALLFAPGADLMLTVVTYTAAVWISVRAGWWTAATALVAGTLADSLRPLVLQSGGVAWSSVFSIQLAAPLLVALLIGINVGGRRRYTEALIDRAEQLARERDQQREIATAEERSRIAREMHDIVSHSLTVMVRLAEGAAAGMSTDQRAPAEAMRGVADVGRGAMTDMRRMLGVLGGDEPAERGPQPRIRDLPELADRFRGLGVPVHLELSGEPPEDESLQLAVHRIVQEGLTNALRYARAARAVRVRVACSARGVVLTVDDDGREALSASAIGAGKGLLGVRERVAALGGTVQAGPRPDATGWTIEAAIPVGARP